MLDPNNIAAFIVPDTAAGLRVGVKQLVRAEPRGPLQGLKAQKVEGVKRRIARIEAWVKYILEKR